MGVNAASGERPVTFRLLLGAFCELTLRTLVEHRGDRPDDLEVTKFFGRDIEQHVTPAGVILAYRLREIATRSRQFALRAAELFEE